MAAVGSKWGKWSTEFDTSNLLGEVVAWDVSLKGSEIPLAQVREALDKAGLDQSLVREIPVSDAMRRAVRAVAGDRVVSLVEDTPVSLVYQFTVEVKDAQHQELWATKPGAVLKYQGLGRVSLDKKTGDLDGDDAGLVKQVADGIDFCLNHRSTSDITGLAHRLFKANADVFPLRRQGGCYFVPVIHVGVIDAVQKFLEGCGCTLPRYPVAAGKLTGDSSVRDAIKDGLLAMVESHKQQIASFNGSTRDKTMKAQLDEIKLTQFKIEAYSEYLAQHADQLRKEAEESERLWAEKVEAIIDGRSEEDPSDPATEELEASGTEIEEELATA